MSGWMAGSGGRDQARGPRRKEGSQKHGPWGSQWRWGRRRGKVGIDLVEVRDGNGSYMVGMSIHLILSSSSSSDRSPQGQHHRNRGAPALNVSQPLPHRPQAAVHELDKLITTVAGGHALAAQDPHVDDSACAVGWNLGLSRRQSGDGRGCGLPHSEPRDPFGQLVAPGCCWVVFGDAQTFSSSQSTKTPRGAFESTTADTHHIAPLKRMLPFNAMLMIFQRIPISSQHFSVALQST
jgi:hypothetical protein